MFGNPQQIKHGTYFSNATATNCALPEHFKVAKIVFAPGCFCQRVPWVVSIVAGGGQSAAKSRVKNLRMSLYLDTALCSLVEL